MSIQGQPILILKEGTERSTGRDARASNIMAARIVSEAVKTSLGPKGMDKMLVDSFGDVTITNDGATMLKEMDVQHPAAKMMVEVSKTQDDEVGDGTTSVVILTGELLGKATELMEKKVHPTVIIDGYKMAEEEALRILESIAEKVDSNDKEVLKKVSMTTMASKLINPHSEHLSEIAVEAVLQVAEEDNGSYKVDLDNIKVEKKPGASVTETRLIKIQIESPEQMQAYLDQEEQLLREMVKKVKEAGINVLFCQKGIDDMVQHFLAREGIMAARRLKKSDMEALAKATGAKVVNSVDLLNKEDTGYAELVEERKISDDKMIFVEGCKNPKAVSILIRGGSERVVDEAERSIHDALCVVKDVVQDPRIVGGGGSSEIEIARLLRDYAETLAGRERLAVSAFAEALEVIPTTLAENSGMDPIDAISEMRSAHAKGEKWVGVNGTTNEVGNLADINVWEPMVVKTQAIKSATEAATMLLKIDDIIAVAKSKPPEPPRGGGGGGMGGMPPM